MKTLGLIAFLLCAAAVTARAQYRTGFNGSDAATTAGHVGDQLGSAVDTAHLDRQKQHDEKVRAQHVEPVEGQHRTEKGQELVFHKGEWHAVKASEKGGVAPVEGQHGIYEGQKLTFHKGQWYYDATGAAAGKGEKLAATPR